MESVKRPYTIWRFLSPSSGEVVIVARPTESREFEHEYQQILDRVMAHGPQDAMVEYKGEKR